MSRLLDVLKGLWRRITGVWHRIQGVVASTASGGVHRISTAVTVAVKRHLAAWRHETTYRRTLAAALAAVFATLLPHPAIAAAMGAMIAERPSRRPVWDDDEDDEPRWGHRQPAWSSRPRLWDTLDD